MDFNEYLKNQAIQNYEIYRFPDGYVPVRKNQDGSYVFIPSILLANPIVDFTKNHIVDTVGGHIVFMFLAKDQTTRYDIRQTEYDVEEVDKFLAQLNTHVTDSELRKIFDLED